MTARASEPLRIATRFDDTIHVSGDLDAATAPRLRDALTRTLAAHPQRLTIDVSELDFCDSTGLTVLVQARNHLPATGELVLHGASRQLRHLLRITHLDTTLTLT